MSEWYWVVISVLILFLLILLAGYNALQKRQDNLRKELEKLKYRNTDLETHQRKFELKPHTLKNILANIKEMSNQISRSMDSLSFLLEYIFENSEEHYTSIQNEVDFISGYITLQDNFTIGIKNATLDKSLLDDQNPYYQKKLIPHLVSAYLIENAFKHGDSSHPNFLNIQVKLQDNIFEIEVRNKIRKNYKPEKTGIGLSNMKSRLRHLNDGKYTYVHTQTDDEYTAKLMLILK